MPIVEGVKLGLEDDYPIVDSKRFHFRIKMLIYFINIKLQIFYVIGILSEFMHNKRITNLYISNQVL